MRDETFDLAAREIGASRRRALLGGFGIALAGLVGRNATARGKEKAKGTRPSIRATAPDLMAEGPSASKKKKTVTVARCNCLQDGAYVMGTGDVFCFYATPTLEDEVTCIVQMERCARLAATCKTDRAVTCIETVIDRWTSV